MTGLRLNPCEEGGYDSPEMKAWEAVVASTIYCLFLLPAVLVGLFVIKYGRAKFSVREARIARRIIYGTVAVFWLAFFIKIAFIDPRLQP